VAIAQDPGHRRAQARFQSGLLAWLRSPAEPAGLRDMISVVRERTTDEDEGGGLLLWRSAESFLAALLDGRLAADDEARALARRIERRLAAGAADDDDLRAALFAFVSRRASAGEARPEIGAAAAAGLTATLAATAELLPLVGRRDRCSADQLANWLAAAGALDRAWQTLLRDGLDPCRQRATELVAVALAIGDPACLALAEALASAVGSAEDPGWREAPALRAAIAAALDLVRDPQGPNLPAFPRRSEELVRRLAQGEATLRQSRRTAAETPAPETFRNGANERLEAIAGLLASTPLPVAALREALSWFATQPPGKPMAIRGLVTLWQEALAGDGEPEALAAAGHKAAGALRAAIEDVSLGRAVHPDDEAFAALRALRRAAAMRAD
jgi:hypothetical protein